MSRSPWERALGSAAGQLNPQLRAYFEAIPAGMVGSGSGTFRVVGTRRRWLWPILSLLGLDGIAFPVWAADVPFTVTNRSTAAGTVRATRVFHLPGGDRVMHDEVGVTSAGLVDRLGRRALIEAQLSASVVGGSLQLTSTGMTARLGPLRIPLGVLSPRVTLEERAVAAGQHVSLRIEAPIIGLIYEYDGSFTYAVEDER